MTTSSLLFLFSFFQATCALGEVMELEELEDLVQQHYPMFFGSLILRIGTSNGKELSKQSQMSK
jgi:hypothetical protein